MTNLNTPPLYYNKHSKVSATDFANTVAQFKLNDNIDIRDAYEASMNYMYGKRNDPPAVQSEKRIRTMLVNTIRHRYSNYNDLTWQVNSVCRNYPYRYNVYRNIVLNQIAERFPYLADECEKQKNEVEMVKVVKYHKRHR